MNARKLMSGTWLCLALLAFAVTGCNDAGNPAVEAAVPVSEFGAAQDVHLLDVDDSKAFDGLDFDKVFDVRVEDALDVAQVFPGGAATFTSPRAFEQVSLFAQFNEASLLQYRVRAEDGSWSAWDAVEITWSEEGLSVGRVLLDEPARTIELRGAEFLEFVHMEFLAVAIARTEWLTRDLPLDLGPTGEQLGDDLARVRQAVAPRSLVIPRAEWGARNPGKICGNVVTPYRMTIHHTAVPGSDGADVHRTIRGMQAYHIDNNRWCDIGYHFIVSQQGRIYQGRSDERRPGAHVGNQNAGNVGISFIANFNSQTPTSTQMNAGGRIVGWVHRTYNIPLTRTAVRGHREWPGQSTSCPGANMMSRMGNLLQRAANPDGGQNPEPPPAPIPPPGGCTPSAHPDATSSFFKDFPPGQTGHDEAAVLFRENITLGCSADPRMFCPNCPTTRLAMVTLLVRAAGLDVSNPPATPTFADVPTSSPFYAYAEAAAAAGITQGCGGGNFCPTNVVNRAQAATLIRRTLGWQEVEPLAPTFADVPADHTHYIGVETLKQRCVTQGCGDGSNFCPDQEVSRAHAAVFIARAFNLEAINPCADIEPPQPGGCTGLAAAGAEQSFFKDLPPGQAGYEEAQILYRENITLGCKAAPERMFCPKCPTSRRAMVSFLVRAAGLDTSNPPATATFEDVPVTSSIFAEVEAAVEAGITSGCSEGRFCPNDPITRAQLATMIRRTTGWPEVTPAQPSFSDVAPSSGHAGSIEAMVERCVTNGCAAGKFCPTRGVSRAHAAIFIARAFNLEEINPCAEDLGVVPAPVFGDDGDELDDFSGTDQGDEPWRDDEDDTNGGADTGAGGGDIGRGVDDTGSGNAGADSPAKVAEGCGVVGGGESGGGDLVFGVLLGALLFVRRRLRRG